MASRFLAAVPILRDSAGTTEPRRHADTILAEMRDAEFHDQTPRRHARRRSARAR